MAVNIKFAKVRPDAKIPTKRREDLGYDIYANFEADWLEIPPHENRLIPTGIASALDPEWGFELRERGSTGVKNLKISAGIIDPGFRSEWFVCLYNGNDKPVCIAKYLNGEQSPENKNAIIYPYDKAIAQALLVWNPDTNEETIPYADLQAIPSERGCGQLGSSNK